MRVNHSPPATLLDLDREVDPSVLEEWHTFIGQGVNSSHNMPSTGKRNTLNHHTRGSNSIMPGDTAYGLHPDLVGLTEIPVSSSSSPGHSSGLQPSLGYMLANAESTGPFLAPADYLSDPRASPVSEAMGSLYTWSNASDADMLRPSVSVDSSTCPSSSSPFMQSYFAFEPSQQQHHHHTLDPQLSGASGYTPQQINQWCIDAHPNGSFHQTTTASYNTLHQLPSYPTPTPEMNQQPSPYHPLNDTMTTTPEAWFNLHITEMPTTHGTGYLSPPLVPAMSLRSPSLMRSSPTPTTISDFDGRGQPSSPPNLNPADLSRYGIPTSDGAWRCAHPGCTSQAVFRRGCDLRKHFNRHRKHLFCRHEGCPQSRQGGFSSKKDRARHEAKHNPGIVCEWDGCGRVFSRVDNMKDHVRRIHRRGVSG
ncbi:uncharacterized protein N7483_010019 [Penicillium malachiteum]|uniref:uncharacterized protein n=1 Tax=Penicillium malachiteum TaxID=1324776 RepID=UPI0025479F6C|nr:uncharacterized protein N7483_010019 [Penicillium malachiteum]KAJ5718937.1 hypothetical protein N7483_010019 [Penicillium malachiteum]